MVIWWTIGMGAPQSLFVLISICDSQIDFKILKTARKKAVVAQI